MRAILKKELKLYFLSPIGYIYIGIFLLAASLFFYLDIFKNLGNTKFNSMFGSLATVLTFIIPLLTMRMFAEERKNGTDVITFTAPISITKIVLGKFCAAAIVVLISTLATLLHFCILSFFGNPELGSSIITIIGFTLLAFSYIAFGMFASSITENQIVAGVISIGFFTFSWFFPFISKTMSSTWQKLSLMYAYYSSFYNGNITLRDLVFFITFIGMFITLTIIVLQRRKLVK